MGLKGRVLGMSGKISRAPDNLIEKLENHFYNNTSLSIPSINIYMSVIRLYFSKNKEVDANRINKFLTLHGRERRSYYMKYAFKPLLTLLKKDRLYDQLICPKILPTKKIWEDYPMSVLKKVISHLAKDNHKLIAEIQLMTGGRISDVLRAEHKDIFLDNEEDTIIRLKTKFGKQRFSPITPGLAERINKVKGTSDKGTFDFVFIDPTEESKKEIERAINRKRTYYKFDLSKASKKIGVHLSSHYFRRKLASDMKAKGYDLYDIQKALGHSSIETTTRYFLGTDSNVKKAIKDVRGIA